MRFGRTSELVCAGLIGLAGLGYVLIPPGQASEDWASPEIMIREQFREEGDVRPLSAPAARVALTALSLDRDVEGRRAMAALDATPSAEIDLGSAGTLQVAILDDDTRDLSQDMFDPQVDDRSPLVLPEPAYSPVVAFNYERSIETVGREGELDVSLTQRAALSLGEDGSAAGAGAELRIGQHLRHRLEDEPRWYMFAGADRRALLYNPAEGADFESAMALTRREVIGDAQAGIALRIGEADIALAYVMRDYRHVAGLETFDEDEEFGAVTIHYTW